MADSDHLSVRADKCKVIGDEDGFVLEIDTDDGEFIRVNIHDCVEVFFESTKQIASYLNEMDQARSLVQAGLGPNGEPMPPVVIGEEWHEDFESGYDADNPKNLRWVDSMASWADDLRKRQQSADHWPEWSTEAVERAAEKELLKEREAQQRADHINPPGRNQ